VGGQGENPPPDAPKGDGLRERKPTTSREGREKGSRGKEEEGNALGKGENKKDNFMVCAGKRARKKGFQGRGGGGKKKETQVSGIF